MRSLAAFAFLLLTIALTGANGSAENILPEAAQPANGVVHVGDIDGSGAFVSRCLATLLAPDRALVAVACYASVPGVPVVQTGATLTAVGQRRGVVTALPSNFAVLQGSPADFVVLVLDAPFDCLSGFVRPVQMLPPELASFEEPGNDFIMTSRYCSGGSCVLEGFDQVTGDGCLIGPVAGLEGAFFCTFSTTGPCFESLAPTFVLVDGQYYLSGFFVARLPFDPLLPCEGPAFFLRISITRFFLDPLLPAERDCPQLCPPAPTGFYTVCEEVCRDPPTFERRLVSTGDQDYLLRNPTAVLPAQFPAVDCLCDVQHLEGSDDAPAFFLDPVTTCQPAGCQP